MNYFKSHVLKAQTVVLASLVVLFSARGCYAYPGNENITGNNSTLSVNSTFYTISVDTSFQGLVSNEDRLRGGLLFDATANKVVWQKDMHYAYPIASLTKMMVALLVVEDINNCKADWNDEVTFTKQYIKKVKRKKIKYSATETYTLDALFHLAMIASNNEACMQIAKHLDGNVEDFVARMNARARTLEMTNTYYSNPSGLPAGRGDSDNNSSPHDLLLLSLEMLKYPEITKVTRIGYADIANDKSSGIYRNHNHLVIDYENEVDGLKTGYTKNARFCLAATSYKNNHRLISIILGVRSPYERNEIVADMLSNYYEKIGVGRLTNNVALPKIVRPEPELMANVDTEDEPDTAVYKTVWTREKKYHTVKGGETLSGIAEKYSCSTSAVKKWNHLRTSKVMKGQKMLVYTSVKKKIKISEDQIEKDGNNEEIPSTEAVAYNNKIEKKAAKAIKNITNKSAATTKIAKNFVYHTVQPGDTLWNIAQRYKGVTVEEIKKTNKISSAKGLKAGTKLKIILNS